MKNLTIAKWTFQVGFDSWEDSRKESRRDREVLDNEKQ